MLFVLMVATSLSLYNANLSNENAPDLYIYSILNFYSTFFFPC